MKIAVVLSALIVQTWAIFLDVNNVTNMKEVTKLIANGLLDYYEGTKYGGTVGMFSWPYYWWEAGGAMGSLLDYTYYMEDESLVPLVKEALMYQVGDQYNYIPLNQSTTEGNDDQGFWGLVAMQAVEKNFSNPSDPKMAWLTLVQGVFNTMAARWDPSCGGGLRWQIFQWNSGYDYKNSVSNGCLFNIGARLARYTGNDSYADWATKVWDWMDGSGLLTEGDHWYVYDGFDVSDCSNITKFQWSYNQGLMLLGAAYMYNYTLNETWRTRALYLLNGTGVFFNTTTGLAIMYEVACQRPERTTCNNDQRSFKAYLSRFLGSTLIMMPETKPVIDKYLIDSANAAALSCLGGTDGHTCGINWSLGSWDGFYGLGEQMLALEVMCNVRVHDLPPPYTAENGGSSIGNPANGFAPTRTLGQPLLLDKGDAAGAGVITAVLGASLVGTVVWLLI